MKIIFLSSFLILYLVVPVAKAQETVEDEILVDWELTLTQAVMKYEKPRCIKFFWIPGGCPESREALDFKGQCKIDTAATQKDFHLDVVSNLMPKFTWYQKQVGFLYYNQSTIKSNSEGNINLTEHLEDFVGVKGFLKLDDQGHLEPAINTEKKVAYIADFDGKNMNFTQDFSGDESILVTAGELKSLVIRRALCPNSAAVKKWAKGKKGFEFAYIMSVLTPVQQN